MSYENTSCPCGGTKERETMLCASCVTRYADHPAMKVFNDNSNTTESRRHAAIVLVTLARSRRIQDTRRDTSKLRLDTH